MSPFRTTSWFTLTPSSGMGRQVLPASNVASAPRKSTMATARHASANASDRMRVAGGSGPSETCRPESTSIARRSPVVIRAYRRSKPAVISSTTPQISAMGSKLSSQPFARQTCVSAPDAT
jgi:hypothetical protein